MKITSSQESTIVDYLVGGKCTSCDIAEAFNTTEEIVSEAINATEIIARFRSLDEDDDEGWDELLEDFVREIVY